MRVPRSAFAAFLCLAAAVPAGRGQTPPPAAPLPAAVRSGGVGEDAPIVQALRNHLELGTRMTYVAWMDTDHEFIGSINGVDAAQNLMPDRFFADWYFTPCWGVELTWDEIRARSRSDGQNADGDFLMRGPILTAFGRYVNFSPFTPSAGIGLGYMFGGWQGETWWTYGYGSYDDWAQSGSPSESMDGKMRTMEVSDAVAFVLTGACDVRMTPRWSANVYARYMYVTTDLKANIYQGSRLVDQLNSTGVQMSNLALGLGVKYSF